MAKLLKNHDIFKLIPSLLHQMAWYCRLEYLASRSLLPFQMMSDIEPVNDWSEKYILGSHCQDILNSTWMPDERTNSFITWLNSESPTWIRGNETTQTIVDMIQIGQWYRFKKKVNFFSLRAEEFFYLRLLPEIGSEYAESRYRSAIKFQFRKMINKNTCKIANLGWERRRESG